MSAKTVLGLVRVTVLGLVRVTDPTPETVRAAEIVLAPVRQVGVSVIKQRRDQAIAVEAPIVAGAIAAAVVRAFLIVAVAAAVLHGRVLVAAAVWVAAVVAVGVAVCVAEV